jgi:hypothetical protein
MHATAILAPEARPGHGMGARGESALGGRRRAAGAILLMEDGAANVLGYAEKTLGRIGVTHATLIVEQAAIALLP